MIRIFFLITLLSFVTLLNAQIKEQKTHKHSPKAATLQYAILPGLGQVYNKKYWKLPFIYAGLGTFIYFAIDNNKKVSEYNTIINDRLNGNTTYKEFKHIGLNTNQLASISDAGLASNKNSYRRNMELSIIGGILIYAINVIDANVDAHLMEFDVSDDLTLQVLPQQYFIGKSYKLGISLSFKL